MRTREIVDPDGTRETIEEPITVGDPDLRAALHGLRLAMVLDALEQPAGREIIASRPDDAKGDAETVHAEEQAATGTDDVDTGPTPESVVAKLRGLRLVRPEE